MQTPENSVVINPVSCLHSFLVRILFLTEHSRLCILRDECIRKVEWKCSAEVDGREG